MTANVLEDKLWLTANSKEAEFELFCKQNDLDQKEPMSLKIFINEEISETISKKKDSAESFYANGFFICWADLRDNYRLFTKNPFEALDFSQRLARDNKVIWVERYQVKNGEMKLVCRGA